MAAHEEADFETASQEHLATGARGLTASGSSYVENVYAAFPVFAPLALVWIELDTANTCIDMQLGMVVSSTPYFSRSSRPAAF